MNKEGYGIIFVFLACALVLGFFALYSHNKSMALLFWIDVLLLVFMLYFFRDPQRIPPGNPKAIVAPADGKVIAIEKVEEPLFVNDSVIKVSIFLSIFDVHVNYVPYNGVVEYLRYNRGAYLRADKPQASEKNAHTFIGLETKYGKMAFKQSTGILARRIVCNLREGDRVQTAEKFGIIKFGSRMEVFIPSWARVIVNIHEKVRAGESVIAVINEK